MYQRSGNWNEKNVELCLVFTTSTKREIRHFHVVVVQWRQKNVQKSVLHVQSCCFANLNLLIFCRSRWRRRRRCLSLSIHYHSKQIFLSFHWPRAHHVTCKKLPTNNGLLMRNAVQLCLAANYIVHMRKGNRAFLLLAIAFAAMADRFVSRGYSLKKTNSVIKW